MQCTEGIIKNCLKNNVKAQGKLYRTYAPKMYGICLRFAKNHQEAEDILQEGFIKVFANLKTFRNEGVFEAWIRRIMINTAINFYKRKYPAFQDIDFERWRNRRFDEDIVAGLSYNELMECIHQLPNGYRLVFNLNAIEGYTHKEISEKLNISINTSKSQLSRARKTLQNIISKNHKLSYPADNLLAELIVP